MPELPDVELFRRIFTKHALDKEVARVAVQDVRILGKLPAATLARRLQGGRFTEARRHGKHLLAKLDKGGWLTLHFGMTGALHYFAEPGEEPPFTRVRLDFAGDGHLGYSNKRMIGRVGFAEDAAAFVAAEKLGPDALDKSFDLDRLKAAAAGTKREVKSVLMDQELVAGIGNVYADEILFQAGIDPRTPVGALEPARLKRLYQKSREVLETAIAHGAGAEQFTDRMPKGSLLPERRKGGHCPRCHAPLQVFKVGGRTTYCCAHCQG
jgi:formamidopyrimidine-DNA glycosylase